MEKINFIYPAMAGKKIKKDRGFVILFAVTISAILLAIALGVANIALKEIKFSTSAKDTNDSFFAADSGVECALFYDKTVGGVFISPSSPSIICNSGTVTANESPSSFWTFNVSGLGAFAQGCAKVTINKIYVPITTIISKGYNNGGTGAGVCAPSTNSIERELKVTYGGTSLNFDFEDGSVGSCPNNWICTVDAKTASLSDGQGCLVASNVSGNKYLKAGCDGTIGTAKSANFTLPLNTDHIRALRAGGADAGTGSGWFVKRVSDNAILCSAQNGADTDTFFNDDCTGLSSYVGTSVYIYVVDNVNGGWGKTYLDNIRIQDVSNNNL